MPVVDTRMLPLMEARFYYPGQGDPVVKDPGMVWYDDLAQTHGYGSSSKDANDISLLEWVEAVGGLACRPFLIEQDTRSSQFTTSGGTWAEIRPGVGTLTYRLWQLSAAADLVWSATSTYYLQANSDFALWLDPLETPADHDQTTYPPYVRVEWGSQGSEGWGLLFRRDTGNFLLRKSGGAYSIVAELPQPSAHGYQQQSGFLVMIRHLGDALCVSLDRGQTYLAYQHPDGTAAESPAAPLVVRGQGQECGFAVHQLKYFTGVYTPAAKGAGRVRSSSSDLELSAYWHHTPSGCSIAFTDVSDPAAGWAQYTATLTPITAGLGTPFIFYRTPVLAAVEAEYPVTLDPFTGFGTYEVPFEISEASVNKPLKLDEGDALITCRRDTSTQFTGDYRRRKVALLLGHANQDLSSELSGLFVGYVGRVDVRNPRYQEGSAAFGLDNAAIRFKETEWTDFTRRPLGGRTVNAAMSKVFESEGLDSSYYSWHAKGDLVVLPLGTASEPFEFPRRGEKKWETLVRLAGYAGLEIAPLDDATFASGPRDYVAPFVSHTFRQSDPETLIQFPQNLDLSVDYTQSATGVIVYAKDQFGQALTSVLFDRDAEENVWSSRFSPWRVTVQEEISDPTTLGICNIRAGTLGADLFGLKLEPDVSTVVNLALTRRDRVRIIGANVGVADYDEFVILSLRHAYKADPSFATLSTQAGMRRLN